MAFLKFRHKPENKLEEGGRTQLPQAESKQDGSIQGRLKRGLSRKEAEDPAEAAPAKTCPKCKKDIPISSLDARNNVCTCGYHFRMSSRERIRFIVDSNSFNEMFTDVYSKDPIEFPGYQQKLEKIREESGEDEAVICGTATIGGQKCCLFVMDPNFMMGSMGIAVGEKITDLFEYATENRLPVVGFTVSGGARMQEGILSLMQMAKTSGAVKRHNDAGLFYLTILTNPTTGGVTASFAMEGDIILAEPGATVGFAGARVIEQTTGEALPKGFQKSEFVLEHGFIDSIVPRQKMIAVITNILKIHNS